MKTYVRLLVLVGMFLVTIASAVAEQTVYEDFENNSMVQWSAGVIESGAPLNGTYSGDTTRTGANDMEGRTLDGVGNNGEPFNVSGRIRHSVNDDWAFWGVTTAQSGGLANGVQLYMADQLSIPCGGDEDSICYRSSATYTDTGLDCAEATTGAGCKFNIEVNSSSGSGTASVFFLTIDGSQVGPFPTQGEVALTAFDFFNAGGAGSDERMWFDDIEVSNKTALPPGDTGSVNITLISPLDNTQFNTQLLNVSFVVNSTSMFNATLWRNNTIDQEIFDVSGQNDKGLNFSLNFTADESTNFTYFVQVVGNVSSANTTPQNIYIDNVLPTLEMSFPNSSAFYNPSENITAQINCSDTFQVFGVNVSIDNAQIDYRANLNVTFYDYNLSHPVGSVDAGNHTLQVACSDGHTAKNLKKEYKITKGILNDRLTYDYGEGKITIRPKNIGVLDSFMTEKEKDRYTFAYEPLFANTIQEFDVYAESNQPMYVVSNPNPEDPIKEWIVIGDMWVDFYNPNEPQSQITYTKTSRDTMHVTIINISNSKSKKQQYHSIGELNIVKQEFTFFVGNATTTSVSPVLEGSLNNPFRLNVSIDPSLVTNVDAILNWNNSGYTTTKTNTSSVYSFTTFISPGLITDSGSQQNFSFFWEFNTTIGGNISTSTTNTTNQSIDKFIINNCTGVTDSQTINFTYLEELNILANVNASVEALATLWYQDTTLRRNYSMSYNDAPTSKFCISPDYATVNSSLIFQFFPPSEFDGQIFYKENFGLNTTVQPFNLFFLNATFSTDITITVIDSANKEVPNVIVEAHKFSIVDNNFTKLVTEKTDPNGQVIMKLYVPDSQYKFIVKQDGINVFESQTTKLFTDSYTFRINDLTQVGIPELSIQNIQHTLFYNSTEQNVTLTWNDVSGLANKYYLDLYRTNATGAELVSQVNSTATSDKSNILITNTTGRYIASFYVNFTGDGNKYLVESIEINDREEYTTYGSETLLISFLVFGTSILIGLFISAEVALVVLLFEVLIFFLLGMLNFGTGATTIGSLIILIVILIKRAEE